MGQSEAYQPPAGSAWSTHSLPETLRKSAVLRNAALCAVVLGGLASIYWSAPPPPRPPPSAAIEHAHVPGITQAQLEDGLKQCARDQQRPITDYALASRRLAARNATAPCRVYQNATVIQGDGHITREQTVVLQGDIITYVGSDAAQTVEACPVGSGFVDLAGRYLSPGLIDLHSHVGLRQEPQIWANEDVTESSAPVTPWARAIDGFKVGDEGIRIVASGGTTTSLVLTGAMNLISGEGMVIKHRPTKSVWEQEIDSTSAGGSPKKFRHLKMACGENIKGKFKDRPGGPVSRQGESAYVRFAFEAARKLKEQQDAWCAAADTNNGASLSVVYPRSIHDQTLVDLLRGDLLTHIHCYQPQDVFAQYDHADEFGYNITALHHITQAFEMLDEIKRRGSVLATFSDEGGFKNENYHFSWSMLRRAAAAGIPIALTTDHPAKHGQFLANEAQIGHHFGLAEDLAMASMLSVSAATIGLDNRIGWLRPGYDADLVVWDAHPLSLGATPLEVVIDAKTIVSASADLWTRSLALPQVHAPAPASRVQKDEATSSQVCAKGQTDVVLKGVQSSFLEGLTWPSAAAPDGEKEEEHGKSEDGTVAVVRDGIVQCVGSASCLSLASKAIHEGVRVIELENGHLLPGIAMVTRTHGLVEMVEESSTQDGFLSGNDVTHIVSAVDGLQFGDHHLEFDHRRGITTLITAPASTGFMNGLSTAFRPGAAHALDSGAIINPAVGLLVSIGEEGKTSTYPTISSQFTQLRDLLADAANSKPAHPVYTLVANGSLPLIVRTDNKDIIAKTLALKTTFTKLRPIIYGGGEAYLLADELAAAAVPVLLAPWQCSQLTWEVRNCLPGPPLTDNRNADILLDAGVTLGLGNWDHRDRWVPNALWEASWLMRARGVEDKEGQSGLHVQNAQRTAVAMVSTNTRKMFGLPVNDNKEFVVYEGNPFEYGARVALIVEQGSVERCWPDVQ